MPVLDADRARVFLNIMVIVLKCHGKARVSLLQGLSQSDCAVVAALWSPDPFTIEFERALINVAFHRCLLVLDQDFHGCCVGSGWSCQMRNAHVK